MDGSGEFQMDRTTAENTPSLEDRQDRPSIFLGRVKNRQTEGADKVSRYRRRGHGREEGI